MLAPSHQFEFDWQLAHARPWLFIHECAAALDCSPNHIANLIDDGSIDFAVDIGYREPRLDLSNPFDPSDLPRRCVRIFRPSFDRFRNHRFGPDTNFAQVITIYLSSVRDVFSTQEVANHLRCTQAHICNIVPDLGVDISSTASPRACPRIPRAKLIAWLIHRRIA